jgi:hypothetical protein
MSSTFRFALLLALLLTFITFASGQRTPAHKLPPPQSGPPQDLANSLVQMARASHVALIAELVQPMPSVPTSEGKPLNSQSLNQLLQLAPGYEWKMEGKTVHFYNKKLRQARFNFLNLKFPRFTVPPNLNDFHLFFPGSAMGLLEGYTGEGGVSGGLGNALLEEETLKSETLLNVTPLEVLLHLADESPKFYAVVVFPNAAPKKIEAEKQVIWHIGSLKEKLQPIFTQTFQPTRNK